MRRRGRGQLALIALLADLRGIPFSPGHCVHSLEYGVASADLKPSTLWEGNSFTVSL
jgi:hypothetical protein